MSIDNLKKIIGQKIIDVNISDDKRVLSLKTKTHLFKIEADGPAIHDGGDCWLDDQNVDFHDLINKTINDVKESSNHVVSEADIARLSKIHNISIHNESSPHWDFLDLITSTDSFQIRFFCTEGTYYAGDFRTSVSEIT